MSIERNITSPSNKAIRSIYFKCPTKGILKSWIQLNFDLRKELKLYTVSLNPRRKPQWFSDQVFKAGYINPDTVMS